MPETPRHTYPPGSEPGSHWALTEAWAILDTISPGALSDDMRAWLAGQITGTLLRRVKEAQRKEEPHACT